MDAPLDDRPRAETWKVHELVREALRGRLRVPEFQRGLRWGADDVAALLDSVYRGYPVGSLLLWRGRPTPEAGACALAGHVIAHPTTDDVRWIVDGQQRVTALALSLTRHGGDDPRFRIWFDPDGTGFHPVGVRHRPEGHWVAVHELLDANALQEMLFSWTPGNPERRRAIIEAGNRLRDYELPAYVLTSVTDAPLREVYRRANRSGKALTEPEVFDAFARHGATLREVSTRLADLGWGTLSEETLLRIALCVAGKDPTRTDAADLGREEVESATVELEGHVRATIHLLREMGIVHVSAMPYQIPLIALPAFLARFPRPIARSRTLLRRWAWRSFFVDRPGDPRHLRAAQRAIVEATDEEGAVQQLLRLVPTQGPAWVIDPDRRARFDAAFDRLGMLALAHLEPMDLTTLAAVDVPALLSLGTIPRLETANVPYAATIARWWLHPEVADGRALVAGADAEALASHAIPQDAARALAAGDDAAFLALRAARMEEVVRRVVASRAEWGMSDRPSLLGALVA